ncbi:hypothetical protein OBK15_07250 [Empedobacter falsenii]
MKYSDYQNKLFRVYILFNFLLLFSCSNKADCAFSAKLNADSECTIIVSKLPSTVFFDAKGIDPITKKECKCSEGDRWWTQYKEEIEIGDTIIKRKGELTFNIHKKDTIISHEWECEGKTYNSDGTIKEVLKKQ